MRFWRLGAPGLEKDWAPPKGLKRLIEGSWSLSCIVLVPGVLLSGSWWSNIRKMYSLLMCANQFRKDILPGEVISDLRCSGSYLRNQPLPCFLYFPFPRDHQERLHCEVMNACRPLALAMNLFLKDMELSDEIHTEYPYSMLICSRGLFKCTEISLFMP